jgi:parallel beta-helix repeat protein
MLRWHSCLLLVLPLAALADTTEVSGPVSGIWDPAGSPYAVVGEVTVPAGETLIIRPGVEVRFRGRFHFFVSGLLRAVGTEADSVVFTRDQPTEEHKWKGIRFDTSAAGCSLVFCRVEYVKNDGPYPEVRGGAVYCRNSSPVIRRSALCRNYSHNANYNGGGGGVFAEFSSPVVESCHVFDNYVDSGGGFCTLEDCSAVFRWNVIEDNTAAYSGGGMYLGVRSGPLVEGNIIRRNRCSGGWGGGGITLWNWYAIGPVSKTVINNLIVDNTASDAGGGIYTRYDLSFIYNNTITRNRAGRGGGVYVLNEGQYLPDIRNCIIWGDSAPNGPEVYLDQGNNSQVDITWSDVQGGWPGTGNFDSVPAFHEDTFCTLPKHSCCVDRGTSDGTPDHDWKGCMRVDQVEVPNRGGGWWPFYDVGWDECNWVGVEEPAASRPSPPGRTATRVVRSLPPGSAAYDVSGKRVTAARAGVCVIRDETGLHRVLLVR